jgi:hypothetical protein
MWEKRMFSSLISPVLITVIILAALPTILMPYSNYKNFFESVNEIPVTHISKGEYDGLNWFRTNIDIKKNPDSYAISDYATAFMIRGMTDLNTTANRHPQMSVQNWKVMQDKTKTIFSRKINETTYRTINMIQKETQSSDIYVVLSKRTCWWIQQNNSLAIRYLPLPDTYTFTNYCSDIDGRLHSASELKLIFHNNDIAIYKYAQARPI